MVICQKEEQQSKIKEVKVTLMIYCYTKDSFLKCQKLPSICLYAYAMELAKQ